jgi:hypothetical protein
VRKKISRTKAIIDSSGGMLPPKSRRDEEFSPAVARRELPWGEPPGRILTLKELN